MSTAAGLFAAMRAAAAAPPIESASLAFPAANLGMEAGRFAHLEATGLVAPLLAAEEAFVAILEAPWHAFGAEGTATVAVLGNAALPSGAGDFALRLRRLANGAGAEVLADLGGTALVAALPAGLPAPRLLVAIRSAAGSLSLDVFSEGAKIASAAPAAGFPGLTLDGGGFLVGCGGASGSLAPDTLRAGFSGMIGFVGHHDGALGDAALAAISDGRPVEAETDPAAWRLARRLDDPAAASHGPAPWATGDALPAWTKQGGGALAAGSDLVPAADGAGGRLSLDPILDGQVWGALPGGTTAPVALSGRSAGLAGDLEARMVYPDGTVHADWTPLGVDLSGGGAWAATLDMALCTGGWAHLELRAAAEPALLQRSRANCGAGFVFPMWGQSNLNTCWGRRPGGRVPAAPGPVTYAGLDVLRYEEGTGNVHAWRLDDGRSYRAALAGAAEEWGLWSGVPAMVVNFGVNGAGYIELVDDATPGRAWSDILRVTEVVGAAGTSHLLHWYPSITTADRLDEFVDGNWRAGALDHYLRDGAPWPAGMGVVLSRSDGWSPPDDIYSPGTPYGDPDWPSSDMEPTVARARRGAIREWYVRENRIWEQYGLDNGYRLGPLKSDRLRDGGHAGDDASAERACRRDMVLFAREAGAAVQADPFISSVSITPDLTTIVVQIDKAGASGDLTTEWIEAGGTAPDGVSTVAGFDTWQPSDEFPSRSAAEWTVADAAAGIVHGRKADGGTWELGTDVLYLAGDQLGYGRPFVDTAELWKGIPRIKGPHEGGLGLPVVYTAKTYTPETRPKTAWLQPRPATPAVRLASTAGDYWIVEPQYCLNAAGQPAALGETVATWTGRMGRADFVADTVYQTAPLPRLRQDADGAHYLDFAGASMATDAEVGDSSRFVAMLACADWDKPASLETTAFVWNGTDPLMWRARLASSDIPILYYDDNAVSFGGGFNQFVQSGLTISQLMLEKHVQIFRFGADVPESSFGMAFNTWAWNHHEDIPAAVDIPAQRGNLVIGNTVLTSGRVYGLMYVDGDSAIHRRSEIQWWAGRMKAHSFRTQL